MKKTILSSLAAYALMGATFCWAQAAQPDAGDYVNDPWENVNHQIFNFNLCVDRMIIKPVAETYHHLPHDMRRAVGNVLTNLSEPLNTIHGVLQANPKVAFTSLWRFVLNTTFGFAGIRDFAGEEAGLHTMGQDLGKTLGHWGVGAGPYVVLPVLGPSSARDTTGKVGDWFLDPVGWVLTTPENVGEAVIDGIHTRDAQSGIINHIYYESLDPYVAARSAYIQHEAFTVSGKGH